MKELMGKLSRPFNNDEVQLKVQATNRDRTKGMVVAYVDARAVLDRLDEVVGPNNWYDEYQVLADVRSNEGRLVEVKCRLTIMGVSKEDVGEGDTLKAAFSDALKRAAVKFGVGRYLYSLPKIWVDLDERGNIVNYEAAKRKLLGSGDEGDNPPWEEPEPPKPAGDEITVQQKKMIYALMAKMDDGFSKLPKDQQKDEIRQMMEAALGREVKDPGAISKADASKVIDFLQSSLAL